MGRFQRSERGGQVDPQEALRKAREGVARERSERGEDWGEGDAEAGRKDHVEHVEDELERQDERPSDED
jgi:hypothetical protein